MPTTTTKGEIGERITRCTDAIVKQSDTNMTGALAQVLFAVAYKHPGIVADVLDEIEAGR